jgi:hypothetical protein
MVAVIHNILIMQRYILEMKNNEEATSILQKMKKRRKRVADMKKRRWMVCAAAMCMLFVCGGCTDKKNNVGTSVIEGDDVRAYSRGSDSSTAEKNDFSELKDGDSVGGLTNTLDIPNSANIDIPVKNCGTVESASINTDHIKVPDTDKMYVKKFSMGKIGAADRETILKSVFDEEDGVFEYPYDLKDEVGQEQRDEIFAHKGADVDYSKDYFIGKIDGVEYILYFYDQSWISDEGFSIQLAATDPVPEDMTGKGATFTEYTSWDPAELITANGGNPSDVQTDETNMSGMDEDAGMVKALDYVDKWGFKDVVPTSQSELYRQYSDEYGETVGYEKDGYSVTFQASVNGQPLYQPDAFGIDTISNQKNAEDSGSFSAERYYYTEQSTYSIAFTGEKLTGFTCTWPMKSAGDIQDAGTLITWDSAVESLKGVMESHFADYTGYNSVEFNDVRLTYFRIKTGDGEYEAIPVYSFAQLDSDHADTYPIQLVLIDARDGSEVSMVQDEARFLNK